VAAEAGIRPLRLRRDRKGHDKAVEATRGHGGRDETVEVNEALEARIRL
jgi:hypothetical protein